MVTANPVPVRASPEIRLDRIQHPYGPCPAALEASALPSDVSVSELTQRLRHRLAGLYHVTPGAILLFGGADVAMRRILDPLAGRLVKFPPSASASWIERQWPGRQAISVARGIAAHSSLEPDIAADLPANAVAVIDSPSDPLGSLLRPADAVRIARACQWLVVDERFAEFGGQSLLSLALEFDNIVVIRSFETWAGLNVFPCAWAVVPQRIATTLASCDLTLQSEAIVPALVTLDNLAAVEATLRLVREERSRLYRLLRKLSFIDPVPSWGPFLAARVGFGKRDELVARLGERGIRVHAPDQAGLADFVRFGIGPRSSMERLRQVLLELAPLLVA